MEEKLGKLSQQELDYIVHQLQKSQKEMGASLAAVPGRFAWQRKKLFSIKPWLVGLVMGALLALVLLAALYIYTQKAAVLKSSTTVESVQKLSSLATAQGHYKAILSKEDNQLFGKSISFNFPGSKRTLFLVVPADVTAGVDLDGITQKDVAINDKEKTIQLTLPAAAIIQDPSIDFKNIQTYSDEGIFRSDANWDEGFELADLAKERIKEDAVQSGLLETAETNAQASLKDFFENMGYEAEITFK